MKEAKYIVVIGCGRLGSILASHLSSSGNSVVIIDLIEERFKNLKSEFSGFTIVGDASELSVLRAAKADKADCLLAVTNKDNINLMVAQIAKEIYKIPQVIARVFDPERQNIYQDFGIATISPTLLSVDALMKKL